MNTAPRVSVNKLMEFRTALPSRQREIVDNQKNPLANKPKMAWCTSARRAIIDFFADGCEHESILDDVPFDLRHLRVIVYDVQDPFWGEKLKNSLTAYLKNAKDEPTKSIPQPFRNSERDEPNEPK